VKQVWKMVLPMLRCWRVLLPLKLMDVFDNVISSLEKLVLGPLRISSDQAIGTVVPDPVKWLRMHGNGDGATNC
jgi:hypothetical protein